MEMVDKNLLELDGEMVDQECVDELAEKIMEVKRAQSEKPQLFEAAARRLIEDGKIIEDDKELSLLKGEKTKLEEEIKQMKKGLSKPKSLKEKMKEAAKEARSKSGEYEEEEDGE